MEMQPRDDIEKNFALCDDASEKPFHQHRVLSSL